MIQSDPISRRRTILALACLAEVLGLVPMLRAEDLAVFGTESATIRQGDSYDYASAWDDARIEMYGGEVHDFVARNRSVIRMEAGHVVNASVSDSAVFELLGGTIAQRITTGAAARFDLQGGDLLEAWLRSSSWCEMSGGIAKWIRVREAATFVLSGGEFYPEPSPDLPISVDLRHGIFASNWSNTIIEGVSFSIGGQILPLGPGEAIVLDLESGYFLPTNPAYAGTWGRSISDIGVVFSDGTSTTVDFYAWSFGALPESNWAGTLTLRAVPAPGVITMMTMIATGASVRRRRS